jgi:ribosomal RNA-processing protein 8
MALFEVPGWSMTSAPAPAPSAVSKKRKRPPGKDADSLHSAEINLEKLVKSLQKADPGGNVKKKSKRKEKRVSQKAGENNQRGKVVDGSPSGRENAKSVSSPKTLKPLKQTQSSADPPVKARKKDISDASSAAETAKPASPTKDSGASLTKLQKSMKSSLDGARFRWINELLYKTDSAEAHKMMKDDPKVYEEVFQEPFFIVQY